MYKWMGEGRGGLDEIRLNNSTKAPPHSPLIYLDFNEWGAFVSAEES